MRRYDLRAMTVRPWVRVGRGSAPGCREGTGRASVEEAGAEGGGVVVGPAVAGEPADGAAELLVDAGEELLHGGGAGHVGVGGPGGEVGGVGVAGAEAVEDGLPARAGLGVVGDDGLAGDSGDVEGEGADDAGAVLSGGAVDDGRAVGAGHDAQGGDDGVAAVVEVAEVVAGGAVRVEAAGGAVLPGEDLVDVDGAGGVGGDVGALSAFGEQGQLVDPDGRYP